MKIPVMNPPHRRRRAARKVRRVVRKVRRKASAAQLAALAKGRAKMAAKRRGHTVKRVRRVRRSRRTRSVLTSGTHRPVIRTVHGRLHRPKRSTIPAHARFANPFAGELMTLGNPRGKGRKRRVIMARHKKTHRRARRRHYGLALRNPLSPSAILSAPKQMISKDFLTEAAFLAAGTVLPAMAMQYVPATFQNTRVKYYLAKVGTVAILSSVAGMVSKRASSSILLGGGISLLLDAYTDIRARIVAAPAAAPGTHQYYGEAPGVSQFYGDVPGVGAEFDDNSNGEGL